MSAVVIALRKCLCGAPGKPRILKHSDVSTPVYVCDTCRDGFDGTLTLFAQVRPVADAMRMCQVPEEILEEVMAHLLTRMDGDENGDTAA